MGSLPGAGGAGIAVLAQQRTGAASIPPACWPAYIGATSAPCAADALSPWLAMPASPTPSIRAPSAAASGRPKTPAAPGIPISDEGIPIGSIGAIAVAPSNANVVYVGTGESDIRSQNSYGIGMFKSTDAGKTWTHIGLENTRQIGRVAIDPTEPESRLCRRAWPHLRRQPRPRRLSLHRRRRDLEEGSVQRRRSRTMSAPSTWPSTPRTRACSTLRCGLRAVRHGRSTRPPTCPAADSTNRPMAATPGRN